MKLSRTPGVARENNRWEECLEEWDEEGEDQCNLENFILILDDDILTSECNLYYMFMSSFYSCTINLIKMLKWKF